MDEHFATLTSAHLRASANYRNAAGHTRFYHLLVPPTFDKHHPDYSLSDIYVEVMEDPEGEDLGNTKKFDTHALIEICLDFTERFDGAELVVDADDDYPAVRLVGWRPMTDEDRQLIRDYIEWAAASQLQRTINQMRQMKKSQPHLWAEVANEPVETP